MDGPSLRLLFETSQWQQPAAVVFWAILVLFCLIGGTYAIVKGDKVTLRPTGIIDVRTQMEKYGKIHNSYPLILAFSAGGLCSLILAAIFAVTVQGTKLCAEVSLIVGDKDVQAVVSAGIGTFYSILTGWLLSETSESRLFTELFRARGIAAFVAGFLIGIQVAHSLTVLFFFPCRPPSTPCPA